MAKKRRPKIDYDKCIGCLICVDMCENGRFKTNAENLPEVDSSKECEDSCGDNCMSNCPTGAISYEE